MNWISIKDRMPKDRDEVWFYVPDQQQVFCGWYEYDHWSEKHLFHQFQLPPRAFYGDDRPDSVTHWMPLNYPQQPQPKEDKQP